MTLKQKTVWYTEELWLTVKKMKKPALFTLHVWKRWGWNIMKKEMIQADIFWKKLISIMKNALTIMTSFHWHTIN